MNDVKSKLLTHSLYLITPANISPNKDILNITEYALSKGSCIIQYRNKQHTKDTLPFIWQLRKLCQQYDSPFIINDNIELATIIDADGIHLGRHDTHINTAREQLGSGKLIGASCYNELKLAVKATQCGADYVVFGSFYPSTTKPNIAAADLSLLHKAKQRIKVPIVAIGGINLQHIKTLRTSGADILAVISCIYQAQYPKQTIDKFFELLTAYE